MQLVCHGLEDSLGNSKLCGSSGSSYLPSEHFDGTNMPDIAGQLSIFLQFLVKNRQNLAPNWYKNRKNGENQLNLVCERKRSKKRSRVVFSRSLFWVPPGVPKSTKNSVFLQNGVRGRFFPRVFCGLLFFLTFGVDVGRFLEVPTLKK